MDAKESINIAMMEVLLNKTDPWIQRIDALVEGIREFMARSTD